MKQQMAVGVFLVVCAASTVSCGDDWVPPDVVLGSEDDAVRIVALDNSFRAQKTSVSAGSEVVFVNGGRNVHDVVPSGGSGDWGVEQASFAPGRTYRVQFTEPGKYPFYCTIHGNDAVGMIGEIEVVP